MLGNKFVMGLKDKFIMGLKDKFIGHVETQQPRTVVQAATFALIQEGVLERSWNC
jgi:hypothetical protein